MNPGTPTTRRQASAEVLLGFSEFCVTSLKKTQSLSRVCICVCVCVASQGKRKWLLSLLMLLNDLQEIDIESISKQVSQNFPRGSDQDLRFTHFHKGAKKGLAVCRCLMDRSGTENEEEGEGSVPLVDRVQF